MAEQLEAAGVDVSSPEEIGQMALGERLGVTVRSIVVGAILCVILALAVSFNLTMVRGSFLAGDHDALEALALFFGARSN